MITFEKSKGGKRQERNNLKRSNKHKIDARNQVLNYNRFMLVMENQERTFKYVAFPQG